MNRRAEFRPFSWLNDLYTRGQLDLEPPYQRRSVWPDRYKSDFTTTALLNYPCPAIFLYEQINPDGSFLYKVVDGKQRLTTLLQFVRDELPVSQDFPRQPLPGKVFSSLDDATKLSVWRYAFSIEFVEQENEAIINDIFNRINKNVARLSQQELRHAMFAGPFATGSERLATYTENTLGINFPNIAAQSRRQMKDVENASILLLFVEAGEKATSQSDIDEAYKDREEDWPNGDRADSEFRSTIDLLARVVAEPSGAEIRQSRLKNQADFYSLFAAILELMRGDELPDPQVARERLIGWLAHIRTNRVEEQAPISDDMERYLAAARAASNDAKPRRTRIDILKSMIVEG